MLVLNAPIEAIGPPGSEISTYETKLFVYTCCALSVFLRWVMHGGHSLFSHAGIKGLQPAKGCIAFLSSPICLPFPPDFQARSLTGQN